MPGCLCHVPTDLSAGGPGEGARRQHSQGLQQEADDDDALVSDARPAEKPIDPPELVIDWSITAHDPEEASRHAQ